jgi:hypothetical protein
MFALILYLFALYPNSSVAPALSVTAVDWLASLLPPVNQEKALGP